MKLYSSMFAIALLFGGGCDHPSEVRPEASSTPSASSAPTSPTAPPAPSSSVAPSPSSSAPPVDPNAPAVTFTLHEVKSGMRYHSHLTSHAEIEGTVAIKTIRSVTDDDTEIDTELLDVHDGVPTRAKLTYTKVVRKRAIDGADKPNPGPIEGHTYFVERANGKLSITGADRKPLTEDETREITTTMMSFGKPDSVAKVLAAKPRRVGERLDDVAQAMKERYEADHVDPEHPDDRSKVDEMVVTFAGVERFADEDVGVLDVTTTTSGTSHGADMTLKTRGKTSFRIAGASLVRIGVDGVSTMKNGLMNGTGKMTIGFEARLLPPKH